MPDTESSIVVNDRNYQWPTSPVVVVCVDGSEPDYIERAVQLACDHDRLDALRHRLRSRLTDSPLCDAKAFARQLEEAFEAMTCDSSLPTPK